MVEIEFTNFDAEAIYRTLVNLLQELQGCGYDTASCCLELITDKLAAAFNQAGDTGG